MSRTFYDEEWELIKEDGSFFKPEEFPSMVALLSGKPVIDTSVGVYNHHLDQHTWLIVNAIPEFRANEESPYHVIVILYDVTERRYAEEDIKIKEALFRGFYDNMKSGSAIFTVINDGSYVCDKGKPDRITA